MKQLTGSEIIIECLKEQGVDTVFGYPGGTILNVYDALYKHQDEINHILTSHEQGAAHAADGYARATGKVGVCMATSGPGATNLVTGIATAYMDSIPVVAITANVGVSLLGKDSFQEVDIAGVVMPITKHSFIVKNVHELADTIRRAFKIAQTGRPGPVLVDVTKDVTANVADFEPKAPEPIERKVTSIKADSLDDAIRMIEKAKRPFILAGGGVITAGMAIYDTMNLIKSDVSTICLGEAASMGAFLLSAGAKGKRMALPSARIMIHQPLGGARGQATDIEIEAKEIRRMKDMLIGIMAENSGQSFDKVKEDILENFGEDIASLVMGASEPDKSLSWEERKKHTIENIKNLDLRHKSIVCADKISNLEDLRILSEISGKYDFSCFKRGYESQKWYYTEVYNSLIFNEEEKTWDCPCHGSRFDENGGVIDNPAMGDLEIK